MAARLSDHIARAQEVVVVALPWLVFGILFLVGTHAIVLQFQDTPDFSIFGISPEDDTVIMKGGIENLRVAITEPGIYRLGLYMKDGVDGSYHLVSFVVTDVQGNYSFSVDTSSLDLGAHFWFVRAIDAQSRIHDSGEMKFTLETVSEEPIVQSSGGENNNGPGDQSGIGSCPGGLGGHESDPSGEKTLKYQTLKRGESYDLRFNKTDVHKIEKITITALETLPPNGIIIHQELRRVTKLPRIENPYKVYDIQLTFPTWGEKAFYSTIFFRFPKEILLPNQRPENIALHVYENGNWMPNPTFLVREDEKNYVMESTLLGFPPFAIGSCTKTWNGYFIP